jgi:hypothetical protein
LSHSRLDNFRILCAIYSNQAQSAKLRHWIARIFPPLAKAAGNCMHANIGDNMNIRQIFADSFHRYFAPVVFAHKMVTTLITNLTRHLANR